MTSEALRSQRVLEHYLTEDIAAKRQHPDLQNVPANVLMQRYAIVKTLLESHFNARGIAAPLDGTPAPRPSAATIEQGIDLQSKIEALRALGLSNEDIGIVRRAIGEAAQSASVIREAPARNPSSLGGQVVNRTPLDRLRDLGLSDQDINRVRDAITGALQSADMRAAPAGERVEAAAIRAARAAVGFTLGDQ